MGKGQTCLRSWSVTSLSPKFCSGLLRALLRYATLASSSFSSHAGTAASCGACPQPLVLAQNKRYKHSTAAIVAWPRNIFSVAARRRCRFSALSSASTDRFIVKQNTNKSSLLAYHANYNQIAGAVVRQVAITMMCYKQAAVWAKHECPNCVFAHTLAHSDGVSSLKLMQVMAFVEQDVPGNQQEFPIRPRV
jgi:hypothetical protein